MTYTPVPYCERVNFNQEPANILSNGAFLLCAIIALALWYSNARQLPETRSPRQYARSDPYLFMCMLLPAVIALGSALFHTRPSFATQLLDIVPIGIFIGLSAALLMLRSGLVGRTTTSAVLLLWLSASIFAGQWPELFRGSLFYVPSLILLAGLTRIRRYQRRLTVVLLLFLCAWLLRTADLPLCDEVVRGTHMYWHLLSALASLVLLTILLSMPSR